ncbi:MAG: hypothetical protein KC549_08145, partial [Myxococcales bacterium]|nr:hypothetical protein [Myxococcales bacterium]
MRSTLDQTQIFANLGEAGFAVVDDVQAIGAGFDAGLDLADINGDGLLDPVIVRAGSLSYRLNLGHGRWSAWVEINDLPFNEAQREFVQLQDLNGDALDDLVLVVGDTLRYALNRGGTRFDEFQTVNQVGGRALPVRVDGTTVLFADMNGSGSDDVVWISPQGEVTYLELFPVRPNLLTRVTNGLGLVTDVTYTALVAERARAARPWAYTLPFPMWMASTVDTYDSLSAQHRRMEYTYADAYYDTQEKAYRGFAEVMVTTPGDETQESGVSLQTYDVGADDRYRNGLLLTSEMYALEGDDWAPLRATASTYEDCDVDEVPANGLAWPIRYVCKTAEEVT